MTDNEPPAKKAKNNRIEKILMTKDPRMRKLNCLYDNGGTEDGCHRETFSTYAELLKHNLDAHRNGSFPCDFCGMYFTSEKDRFHHTGYNMTHII